MTVEQLDLDETFYRLLAFVLIFLVVKFGLQLIASMFDFLKYLPVLGFVSTYYGGDVWIYRVLYTYIPCALFVGYVADRFYSRQY